MKSAPKRIIGRMRGNFKEIMGVPARNLNPAVDIQYPGTAHTTSWRGNFTVSVKSPNLLREFPIGTAITSSILL
jgi:hypothetical protein